MAGLNFNATEVAPQDSFENLPLGWYTAMIVESEEVPNKSSNGTHIAMTFEVVAPQQYTGRKLWLRLNLNNANAQAVEIAQRELSAICHATNILQLQDTQQLHNIPMDIKVGLSKPREGYEQSNEIKGYRAAQGQAQGGSPQVQAPQQMQQPVQQQQQQQQQQAVQQPVQQAVQQQVVQQQAQQQAVQQQAPQGQQPAWAQQQPQQAQQAVQQQQQVEQQPVVDNGQGNPQQVATDQNAQANAEGGRPPWAQQ